MSIKIKFILLCVIIILMIAQLCGCSEYFTAQDTGFYAGDPLSPDVLDSIYDSVSASITEQYPTETDADGDLIVRWLEGGKVWHESASCSSIRKSDPEKVLYGKVEDAISAGKERACSLCSKSDETE